jgi:hypothetical protein
LTRTKLVQIDAVNDVEFHDLKVGNGTQPRFLCKPPPSKASRKPNA